MAKVVITLEDTDDCDIRLSIQHDPPPNPLEPPTPVQVIAFNLETEVKMIRAGAWDDPTDLDDDDDELIDPTDTWVPNE